jgi:hypothetical protein
LSHQKLVHSAPAVKNEIRAGVRFDGRRLRSAALHEALKRRGISANERKVVEYLAPLLERGPLAISNRQIGKLAEVYNDGVTRGLRRAIEHGFLVRDDSTRPHSYQLADEWLTEAV